MLDGVMRRSAIDLDGIDLDGSEWNKGSVCCQT